MDIPVIDISKPGPEVADELVAAAIKYGFLFIKNEGSEMPVDVRDKTFELSRQFFAAPIAEKEPCRIGRDNNGWSAPNSEKLDPANQKNGDFKECFNFGRFDEQGNTQQQLPPTFAENRPVIHEFFSKCEVLCDKLLQLFAIGLKIDPAQGGEDWFSSRHDTSKGGSKRIIRLLYYPPHATTPNSAPNDIRAGAHSDYGSLTLLFRLPTEAGGLEILPPHATPDKQSWTPVPIFPPGTEGDAHPPILVNIGDLLEYWTNGLLKSTVHRVVFPDAAGDGAGKGRYSIAFFNQPVDTTQLEPVPSELVRARAGTWEGKGSEKARDGMTADDYLMMRLAATYGWNPDTGAKAVAQVVG